MRRLFAVVELSVLGFVGIGLVPGCGLQRAANCPGADCTPPEPEPECDGICVPYMDATWDMALVGSAAGDEPPPHCPASAPHAGLAAKEIQLGRALPRNVIACSTNPMPTCDSPTSVCVPFEPSFYPCILQRGTHSCPDAYPIETQVKDAAADPITICCEKAQDLT